MSRNLVIPSDTFMAWFNANTQLDICMRDAKEVSSHLTHPQSPRTLHHNQPSHCTPVAWSSHRNHSSHRIKDIPVIAPQSSQSSHHSHLSHCTTVIPVIAPLSSQSSHRTHASHFTPVFSLANRTMDIRSSYFTTVIKSSHHSYNILIFQCGNCVVFPLISCINSVNLPKKIRA